jgi:hypothetical protein
VAGEIRFLKWAIMIIKEFTGMNNVKQARGEANEPSLVFNSFVSPTKRILKRQGQTKFVDLAGVHSLFGGSVMLCVAGEKLYEVRKGATVELCSVKTQGSKVSYVELNEKIYISCAGWNGIFENGEISDWGQALPDKPMVAGRAGDLPPGTYSVVYTNVNSKGQISGNSPAAQVTFENQSMGISLLGKPSDCLVWITDVNGGQFYLAGNVSQITSPYNTVPLPSFDVILPPKLTCLCGFAGRIWGVNGKIVWYSEAFVPEWFKEGSSFLFQEDIVGLYPVEKGMYVCSKKTTWALDGTDPGRMTVVKVGNGTVPDAVVFADSEKSQEDAPQWESKAQLPVWMSERGLVQGKQYFRIDGLAEEKLLIPDAQEGAGITLKQDGVKQVLLTLKVSKNKNITGLNRVFETGELWTTGFVLGG